MIDNSEKINLALNLLEKFNRKERYHLLRDAVVGTPFKLQEEFLEKINAKLDYRIPDTEDVYVAMDYHLDWIASAIHLVNCYPETAALIGKNEDCKFPNDWKNCLSGDGKRSENGSKKDQVVTGNQADVDLLVAYKSKDTNDGKDILVLVMIEAKLESGWDGVQLKSKGFRLQEIVDSWGPMDWVVPRIVLAGPNAHETAPNFSSETLDQCPDWFFAPPTSKGNRENAQLRRINLMAEHALYQPARKSRDGENWLVRKTRPKKNGSNR